MAGQLGARHWQAGVRPDGKPRPLPHCRRVASRWAGSLPPEVVRVAEVSKQFTVRKDSSLKEQVVTSGEPVAVCSRIPGRSAT